MNDKIKLAEAMGWYDFKGRCKEGPLARFGEPLSSGQKPIRVSIPDPFTDANDDYAVLEWFRERYGIPSLECDDLEMYLPLSIIYQIGDYARAALKVLAGADT